MVETSSESKTPSKEPLEDPDIKIYSFNIEKLNEENADTGSVQWRVS